MYEKDLTLTGFHIENTANDAAFQTKTRIQNLEASVSDYRVHVESLEMQLREYQKEGISLCNFII